MENQEKLIKDVIIRISDKNHIHYIDIDDKEGFINEMTSEILKAINKDNIQLSDLSFSDLISLKEILNNNIQNCVNFEYLDNINKELLSKYQEAERFVTLKIYEFLRKINFNGTQLK